MESMMQKARREKLEGCDPEETVDDEVSTDVVEPEAEVEEPVITAEADPADVEQPTPAEDTLPDDDNAIVEQPDQ
jgi:hypothetical protein